MKKLTTIFFMVFCLSAMFIISCSDDDGPSGPGGTASANLEGTVWVQQSEIRAGCPDSTDNESTTCSSACDAVLINTNGTIELADDDGIFSIPYTKNGSNLMVETEPNETLDIQYVITGNTLTLSFEEDSCNTTVVYTASQSLALVGSSWEKVAQNRENCNDSTNNCEPCTYDPQNIILLADGTGTNTNPNGTQDVTYTMDGPMLEVTFEEGGQTVTLELEYQIIGEILVLKYQEDDGCENTEVFRGS